MPPASPPLLTERLRAATGASHQRLEDVLDLLAEPPSQDRFRRVLEGFYGFHRAWEPAVARHSDLAGIMVGSGRLPLLRADLRALGRTDLQIHALPICDAAGEVVADRSAAIGSLYVMEGSTLGGQVIGRALVSAPWRPPEGLGYFNPYGPQTGARWRAFRAWLDTSAPESDHPAVVRGACATFDALSEWLAPVALC